MSTEPGAQPLFKGDVALCHCVSWHCNVKSCFLEGHRAAPDCQDLLSHTKKQPYFMHVCKTHSSVTLLWHSCDTSDMILSAWRMHGRWNVANAKEGTQRHCHFHVLIFCVDKESNQNCAVKEPDLWKTCLNSARRCSLHLRTLVITKSGYLPLRPKPLLLGWWMFFEFWVWANLMTLNFVSSCMCGRQLHAEPFA